MHGSKLIFFTMCSNTILFSFFLPNIMQTHPLHSHKAILVLKSTSKSCCTAKEIIFIIEWIRAVNRLLAITRAIDCLGFPVKNPIKKMGSIRT